MYSLNEDQFELRGQKKFVRIGISDPQILERIVSDGICKFIHQNEITLVVIKGKKAPKNPNEEEDNSKFGVCHSCHSLVIMQDFATSIENGKNTRRFLNLF
jgi:hypothetical protein